MNSYSGFSFHYVGDECSICKETFVAADIKSNLKCAHGLYSVVLRSLQKYKKKIIIIKHWVQAYNPCNTAYISKLGFLQFATRERCVKVTIFCNIV